MTLNPTFTGATMQIDINQLCVHEYYFYLLKLRLPGVYRTLIDSYLSNGNTKIRARMIVYRVYFYAPHLDHFQELIYFKNYN
jgi:hypothetical protein